MESCAGGDGAAAAAACGMLLPLFLLVLLLLLLLEADSRACWRMLSHGAAGPAHTGA
jgi:hypothetical protein